MDFSLTEAQKMLQTTVRQFVNEHIFPLEQEVMRKPSVGGPQNRLQVVGEENYRRLEKLGRDQGLWALFVPAEYEGAGLGFTEFFIVSAELGRSFVIFDFGGDAPHLFDVANDTLKDKYLMPTVREGRWWCFAQTEPNAGADAAAIETMAVRHGDDWILNGTKVFIGNADIADFALVMAVTDKGKGSHGISMFIVDREMPGRHGYRVVRLVECMGGAAAPCEILFDNCIVPASNLVGELNQGFILAQKFLEIRARLHHAAWDLGIADRCIQLAADYAKQRVTFGQPLSQRQSIQWMLADSLIEAHAVKWTGYQLAWKADQGENVRHEAAMVKVLTDEMVSRVTDRAIQVFGGLGTTGELPLERFYRLVRILRIGGGSMEVMRMLIARNALKGTVSIL